MAVRCDVALADTARMTCIVGVAHRGRVVLGADSSVNSQPGDERTSSTEGKVFKRGSIAFGFAGSFRGGDLLRYLADVSPPAGDVGKWARVELVPMLRAAAKAHEVDWSECEAIVAVSGRLLYLGGDWAVIEPASQIPDQRRTDRWLCCGSGSPWAQGSLYALRNSELTPRQLVTEALEAAEAWCSSVRGPFRFVET